MTRFELLKKYIIKHAKDFNLTEIPLREIRYSYEELSVVYASLNEKSYYYIYVAGKEIEEFSFDERCELFDLVQE